MSQKASERIEKLTLNEIIAAWYADRKGRNSRDEARLIRAIYPPLAEGRPLSPRDVAESSDLPIRSVEIAFRDMRRAGADFDGDGNLIGNALTLRPTPHKFTVDGQKLYAWCAVDTLFLPALVGKTAQVESTCLATGEPIRLTISPSGIETVDPADTVVTVTVPGFSAACEPGQGKGGECASCQSMNYFVSRAAAERHLGPEADVAILDVETVWQLAHTVWVEPYLKGLEQQS